MKRFLSVILFLGCTLPGADLMAQNYLATKKYLTVGDGLSNPIVYAAYQDSRGFVWVSTSRGIDRYDGHKFENITAQFDAQLLNGIHNIEEDTNGLLWYFKGYSRTLEGNFVNGYSGIVIHDPILNTALSFEEKFPNCPFKRIQITRVSGGNNNVICLVLSNGEVWSYDGKQFNKIFERKNHDYLIKALPSIKGTFWINFKNYLYEIERTGEIIQRDSFEAYPIPIFENQDGDLLFRLWYGKVKGKYDKSKALFFIKREQESPTSFFKSWHKITHDWLEERTCTFYQDKQNRIWCFSPNRIAVFDFSGNLLYDLKDEMKDIQWGKLSNVLCFTEEVILFQSLRVNLEGLLSVEVKDNPFEKYLFNESVPISVRGITKLNDSIFHVNNYSQTLLLNIENGKKKDWVYPFLKFPAFGITADKLGNVFSGGHGSFITHSDTSGEYVKSYAVSDLIPDSLGIRDLIVPFSDKNNNLWIGAVNGFLYLDKATQTIKTYDLLNEFDSFKKSRVAHFYENSEGIWLGTSNGVYLLDADKGIVQHHKGFPSNNITYIYEDRQGVFWLGTSDAGLIKWGRNENTIENFNEKHGLSSNTIHAIFEDDFGKLWMSSNLGLIQFDKTSTKTISYFKEDGITHNEFNKTSYFQDKDGTIYFGGLNGITAFHPSDFTKKENIKTKNAIPVITKFEKMDVNSGEILDLTQSFFEQNRIIIQPEDKSFTIHFAILDYSHSRQQKYTYKIDGFEENWVSIKESFIRVNKLPYGNFKLKIKGMSSGGTWGDELVIPVQIIKPFYLKPWFIVVVILIGLLLIWSFIRFWTYRLRKRAEELAIEVFNRTKVIENQKHELEKSNRIKDKFFALIGHDLKSPLVSLKGMARKINFLIQEKRYDDIAKLSNSIDQSSSNMAKLLDNLLNWALLQKNQFEPQPEILDLNAQVNEIVTLYQDIIYSKGIDFQINIPNSFVVFMDRNALLTILRNLTDNAIKYTPSQGKICLWAETDEGKAKIQVENIGIAIKEETIQNVFNNANPSFNKNGSGLGLLICKDLVEMNKGILTIANIKDQSTLVSLLLPHGKQN